MGEVEAMEHVAPSLWWKTFIRLAVTTGMRKAELLNLLLRDMNLDAKEVQVQPKDVETFEVNGRTFRTWEWNAKAKRATARYRFPMRR